MEDFSDVVTVSVDDVARLLGTSPQKITSAILNGTLPIGMVAEADGKTRTRTIIIKKRLKRYLEGDDMHS